ncbi:MAG: hypothetical protein KAS32_01065 [Candidatus Peribacteraceae bacterium]|nr:hypothetical protein [Candidatus Peribacteraceae bacterium]
MAVEKKKKSAKKKSKRETVSDGNFSHADNGECPNRVYISLSKSINIGNYEGIRVEYGMGMAVPDGMSYEKVKKAVLAKCIAGLVPMIEEVEEVLNG